MKKAFIATASSLAFLAYSVVPALATSHDPDTGGTFFKFDDSGVPFSNLGELLSQLLILLFAFAALLAFIFIIIGGIQWITSGGDKIAAQSARDRITAAVVGLVIVVAAFALTLIITTLLGVNIFSGQVEFNPPSGGNIFEPAP